MNANDNESSGGADRLHEQTAAFQKIWAESLSRMAQAAFTFTPDGAPPELARQIRGGIFQAVSQSWEEFMRSPQFLESMKQMMDNAITMRKLTSDFLTRAHHELQGTTRGDMDMIMVAIRHLEKRLLDRMETLVERVDALEAKRSGKGAPASASTSRRSKAAGAKKAAESRRRKR